MPDRDVLLFSTCPQSTDATGAEYLGYRTFILDIPRDEDDLLHTAERFRRAGRLVRA